MPQTSTRSTDHASFTIERRLAHPVQRVFHAFADEDAKAAWFLGPSGQTVGEQVFEFRPGGRETNTGVIHGTVHRLELRYWDIVEDERIIYSYDMHLDDRRISVSLASVEFRPDGAGTHLVLTEHAIFLDGLDGIADRERGTRELLDALEASL